MLPSPQWSLILQLCYVTKSSVIIHSAVVYRQLRKYWGIQSSSRKLQRWRFVAEVRILPGSLLLPERKAYLRLWVVVIIVQEQTKTTMCVSLVERAAPSWLISFPFIVAKSQTYLLLQEAKTISGCEKGSNVCVSLERKHSWETAYLM